MYQKCLDTNKKDITGNMGQAETGTAQLKMYMILLKETILYHNYSGVGGVS